MLGTEIQQQIPRVRRKLKFFHDLIFQEASELEPVLFVLNIQNLMQFYT